MAFADLHDAELAQLVARYQAGGVTLRAQAAQLLTLQQALAAGRRALGEDDGADVRYPGAGAFIR